MCLTCKFLGGSPVQTPCCSLLLSPNNNDDVVDDDDDDDYDDGGDDEDIVAVSLPFHCYYSPSKASQFQLWTHTHPPCSG